MSRIVAIARKKVKHRNKKDPHFHGGLFIGETNRRPAIGQERKEQNADSETSIGKGTDSFAGSEIESVANCSQIGESSKRGQVTIKTPTERWWKFMREFFLSVAVVLAIIAMYVFV